MKTELLIIGGGIIGTCAAITAAGHGASVTVVDAAHNAGSDTNAGSLHVQLQSRFMRLYPEAARNVEASLPLYLEAVREWDRLERDYGPLELLRRGGLMLAEDAAQLHFLEDKAAREARYGLDVEILDRSALERIAPWLGAQIVGAELCRDEGKLNPLVANRRLKAFAETAGVRFVKDRIAALTVDAGGTVLAHSEGTRYSAAQVIVAAAWGAAPLLAAFGLALPTQAEPLHMNITEPAAPAIGHLVQHAERPITLKQLQSGQIVIGGGWPARSRGAAQVPEVLADSMLRNVALAGRLVPAIRSLRVIRTWAGTNTTIDGKSALGRVPGAGRIVVAIPGDAGYTLGPLCGRLAAEIAMEKTSAVNLEFYSPARFAA